MKKVIEFILVCAVLACSMCTWAFADESGLDDSDYVINLGINNSEGNILESKMIENDIYTLKVTAGDITYIPLREVLEYFGCTVAWQSNGDNKGTIYIFKNKTSVVLEIGNPKMSIYNYKVKDGVEVEYTPIEEKYIYTNAEHPDESEHVSPRLHDGKTLIPFRAVLTEYGININADSSSKIITATMDSANKDEVAYLNDVMVRIMIEDYNYKPNRPIMNNAPVPENKVEVSVELPEGVETAENIAVKSGDRSIVLNTETQKYEITGLTAGEKIEVTADGYETATAVFDGTAYEIKIPLKKKVDVPGTTEVTEIPAKAQVIVNGIPEGATDVQVTIGETVAELVDGRYVFNGLETGKYIVSVKVAGYQDYVTEEFEFNGEANYEVEVKLELAKAE